MDNFINKLRQFLKDNNAIKSIDTRSSSGANMNRSLDISDVTTTTFDGPYSASDTGGGGAWVNMAVDDRGNVTKVSLPKSQIGREWAYGDAINPQLLMDATNGDKEAAATVDRLQQVLAEFSGDSAKATSDNSAESGTSSNTSKSDSSTNNTVVPEAQYDFEYEYKPGDSFGQVLLDIGASDGSNLWGPAGDVAYYTQQLREQDMLDNNGNIKLGKKFHLKKRPTSI